MCEREREREEGRDGGSVSGLSRDDEVAGGVRVRAEEWKRREREREKDKERDREREGRERVWREMYEARIRKFARHLGCDSLSLSLSLSLSHALSPSPLAATWASWRSTVSVCPRTGLRLASSSPALPRPVSNQHRGLLFNQTQTNWQGIYDRPLLAVDECGSW